MANELAAIAGEIERIDAQVEQLKTRRTQLEVQRDSLSQVGAVMGVAELHAFVPAVRVHKAYGGRGFLADWIRELLKAAAPGAVDLSTLAVLAEKHFNLELGTPQARGDYRDSTLGRAIRKLVARGVVERLPMPGGTCGPALWRWKSELPDLPVLVPALRSEEAP